MTCPTNLQTAGNVLSASLGLASSVVLILWALKLGPIQRALAGSDAIPSDSPLHEAGQIDAVAGRKQLSELLRAEARHLGVSAGLLFLSFLIGLASQFL